MRPQVISTVVTAASTYDLTTLAIVRDELGITDGASNAKLQRYLTSASVAAAQFCNRVFAVETIQDKFWAQRDKFPRLVSGGMETLQLSRFPVVSVTSVTENDVTLVEDTDFTTDSENGQLTRLDANGYPRRWPIYPIVAIYVSGYANIPTDVADAVIRMVKARWNMRSDPNLRQESIPGVREAQWWIPTGADAGNLTPDVEDILNNYRVPVIA